MAKDITQSESRSERRRRMVAEMSNIRTLKWVGVALAVHMVLILGTSYGYMRDKGLFKWVGLQPVPVVKPTEDASSLKEPVEEPKPAAKSDKPATADKGIAPSVAANPDDKTADPKKPLSKIEQDLNATSKPPVQTLKSIDDLEGPKK